MTVHIPSTQINETLNKLYSDPKTGFIGRDRLWEKVKERYTGITYRDVASFLKNHPVHQVHQRPASQPVVRPIISTHPNERWQMDLVDFTEYSYWNSNYSYILVVVDHYSKYAWTFPLKNKGGTGVNKHIEPILRQFKPSILGSDNGKEFLTNDLKNILKQTGTKHVTSIPYHPRTQGAVERLNGTLKTMLHRYMTNNSTKNWVNALSDITHNYNNSIHSVIKKTPISVFQGKYKVLERIKKQAFDMVVDNKHVRIPKGTFVRISNMTNPNVRKNKLLNKSYKPNWSDEIYQVHTVSRHKDPSYTLKREDGSVVNSIFYSYELQPIEIGNMINPIDTRVNEGLSRRR